MACGRASSNYKNENDRENWSVYVDFIELNTLVATVLVRAKCEQERNGTKECALRRLTLHTGVFYTQREIRQKTVVVQMKFPLRTIDIIDFEINYKLQTADAIAAASTKKAEEMPA